MFIFEETRGIKRRLVKIVEEEVLDLLYSPYRLTVIISRRMRWAGRAAGIGEKRRKEKRTQEKREENRKRERR